MTDTAGPASGPLIGRPADLTRVTAVLDRAGSLLVLGDAGSGKTALLAAAAGHARARDMRVITVPADGPGALPRALDAGWTAPAGRSIARLIDRLTAARPVVVLVDDVHHLDGESRLLLGQMSRLVAAERIVLLLAARGDGTSLGLGAEVDRHHLAGLTEAAAARFLDSRAAGLDGRTRGEVLRRAGGNPLALLCLSDPAVPLPGEFPAQIDAMPPICRRLLRHAAVADDEEHLDTITRAAGAPDGLADWAPAERAGLVSTVGGRVRFRHPLVREALLRAEPAEIARAHLALSRHAADPLRRASHLAAATGGRNEPLAAALEQLAGTGDARARTRALQAAGDLSPDARDAARRYARAASAAALGAMPRWALELRDTAQAPDDTGLALIQAARVTEAVATAHRAGQRHPGDGPVAATALAVAAAAALLSGSDDPLPALPAPAVDEGAAGPLLAGSMAWLRDDSTRAVAELGAAWREHGRAGTPGQVVAHLPILVMALIDAGWWARADLLLDEADRLGAVGGGALLRHVVPAQRAVLEALRGGDVPEAVPPRTGNVFADHLHRRAAGLGALARGDHDRAYLLFRGLFDHAGRPVHSFLGPRALPELAYAAARTGRISPARRIVEGCRRLTGDSPTPRMRMLLAHATALLHTGPAAERHFEEAVADPDGALRWPLEFADAQLNFGLWLRRERRRRESDPHQTDALATFARLGAGGHAARAHRPIRPGAVDRLTAQQRLIARMAADGMSNQQIADRMAVSPRTIGSHLYRIFPILGVRSRRQLPTVFAGAGTGR